MNDHPAAAVALPGGGVMGQLIRETDWSATPLGPIADWPQSLRTAVGICTESRFPMAIWWGPDAIQLYNDGYMPVLGAKHPHSLGQSGMECWAEIWDVVGPLYAAGDGARRSTWADDLLLLMDRHGYLEETYFTFSYSPIRDESGGVGGQLITCAETTERVIGERRLRTLRDLGSRSSEARTAAGACEVAAAILGENPHDVPSAAVYLLETGSRSPRAPRWRVRRTVPTVGPGDRPRRPRGALPLAPRSVGRPRRARRRGPAAAETTVVPLSGAAHAPAVRVPGGDREPTAAASTSPTAPSSSCSPARWPRPSSTRGRMRTTRRRVEALAELDRAKTAFFSNVSHEFRTPLTLLLGPLEDALADPAAPLAGAQRERAEVAHRNALRLLRLVNTLLDFTRLEAGRAEASFDPTDLSALTADLASGFRSAAERAGLRLHRRLRRRCRRRCTSTTTCGRRSSST